MNTTAPTCLGFIMDGNRRWASEQGLEPLAGHAQGQEVFLQCVNWVQEAKIPHAVFYAFSTENWQRAEQEVVYLMSLFESLLERFVVEIETHKVRIKIVGRRSDFSPAIQNKIDTLEQNSAQFTGTTVWIAISYGGRAEIIAATNEAIKNGLPVDEESFSTLLWTAGMPDPDMIIRTSGEERLSNFLPWQSVYSELYFTPKHWPALSKSDFLTILNEYETRERRKGR
jgi:undecaprenyl diphosphate synthase